MLAHRNLLGAVSEGLVRTYLAAAGYEVFSPDSSHSRADFVYLNEKHPVRVQVKTSSSFPRGPHVYEQCRLVREGISVPYSPDEVDEIWIVGTHLWRFPIEDIAGLTSITLGSTNSKPRKTVRQYDSSQYVVVKGSRDRPYKDRATFDDPDPFMPITNSTYAQSTLRKMQYAPR